MKYAAIVTTLLIAALSLWGCGNRFWQDTKKTSGDTVDYVFDTKPTARSYHDQASIPLIEVNHRAADQLYANISRSELEPHSPIYYKRFTNAQAPADNAIFAEVTTQQVVDRLVQRGARITIGTPTADDITISNDMALTKDDPSAQTTMKLPVRAGQLTGEYVIGHDYIYMSARITRLADNAIVAGHNWTIPLTDDVRQLFPYMKREDGLTPTVKTNTP